MLYSKKAKIYNIPMGERKWKVKGELI